MSVVLLSPEELHAIVRAAVDEALAARSEPTSAKPLDRKQLAEALGCSLHHVDKLREAGCPRLVLGDSERFLLPEIIEFARGQQ